MKHNEELPGVQSVIFASIEEVKQEEVYHDINLVKDVSVQVAAELGRTKMPIKDILRLGEGAVIELDRITDEPIELRVDGKVFAMGEIVLIDDHFGIRITEIIACIL